jgi:hypothetical protein
LVKPYIDVGDRSTGEWIRKFDYTLDNDELVWHRDLKTREIEVLEGDGWKFQRDNEIPFQINTSSKFTIEKLVYHRLIKGNTELVLRIKEKE